MLISPRFPRPPPSLLRGARAIAASRRSAHRRRRTEGRAGGAARPAEITALITSLCWFVGVALTAAGLSHRPPPNPLPPCLNNPALFYAPPPRAAAPLRRTPPGESVTQRPREHEGVRGRARPRGFRRRRRAGDERGEGAAPPAARGGQVAREFVKMAEGDARLTLRSFRDYWIIMTDSDLSLIKRCDIQVAICIC